jgi:ribonuclease HI
VHKISRCKSLAYIIKTGELNLAKKFYAVKKGRKVGVFNTWDECRSYVHGYKGAQYKSFENAKEAENFLKANVCVSANESHTAENPPAPKPYEAIAYVDGSYKAKTKEFSCGVIIFCNNEVYKFCEKFYDKELSQMRNVAGEIKGAELAIKFCLENDISKIQIYHDYEGVSKWCSGEWKTNKEGTKAYANFYKESSKKVDINFHKVRGHSGDTYNEIADQLAKKALGII